MKDGARTILVIDDSPLTLKAIRTILELHPPWKVVGEAENGPQGLALYQQMRPDVVILDFQMPGMNGIEVGQEIRKADSNALLILFSLHASKHLEDLAKAAGFDAVLSKVDPYPIVGIIEAMTSKKAAVVIAKATDVQSSSVPAIPDE